MSWLDDTYDDDEPMFCDCGVTLDYGADQCRDCAGAPHDRECTCEQCSTYWAELCERQAPRVRSVRGHALQLKLAVSEQAFLVKLGLDAPARAAVPRREAGLL